METMYLRSKWSSQSVEILQDSEDPLIEQSLGFYRTENSSFENSRFKQWDASAINKTYSAIRERERDNEEDESIAFDGKNLVQIQSNTNPCIHC